MSFFEEFSQDVAYLKSGTFGSTGCGKTTTNALMAIGLHRYIGSKKPVAFYDTERGSGFIHELFRIAGIPLIGRKTRAFSALVRSIPEAEKTVDILVIDSITHPWRELVDAYKKKRNREFISIRDWGPLKTQWHDGYSIPYVNSNVHILMCGRSANIFEDIEEDVGGGRTETKSVKTGTKMATEGETGYEPNLLIEMRRVMKWDGGRYSHEALVVKDRSFSIDGQTVQFIMPRKKDGTADLERLVEENLPWKFVLPHVERLSIGKMVQGIAPDNSQEVFDESGRTAAQQAFAQRDADLEEIESILAKAYPGHDAMNKKRKADILEGVTRALSCQTRSWKRISGYSPQVVNDIRGLVGALHTTQFEAQVREKLELGKSEDGKQVVNADAAVTAVMQLAQDLLQSELASQDLPF